MQNYISVLIQSVINEKKPAGAGYKMLKCKPIT